MSTSQPVRIRCSALPSWPDCNRRVAAQIFAPYIAAAGYRLRQLTQNAGALVGIAVHSISAAATLVKMEGVTARVDDALDFAMSELADSVKKGVIWDEITNTRDTAEKQAIRMARRYQEDVLPRIDPVAVEEELKANLPDGFQLTGRKDSLVREPTRIIDIKTGKMRRISVAQYGGYSMLDRTHRPESQVAILEEIFIPRVSLSKAQPEPASLEFPAAPAEQEAMGIIKDISRAFTEFNEKIVALEPSPETAFRANPRSMLCSPKYCSAWGTDFCRVHAGAR